MSFLFIGGPASLARAAATRSRRSSSLEGELTFACVASRARGVLLGAEQLRELPALVSGHELLEAANQLVVYENLGKGHHSRLLI